VQSAGGAPAQSPFPSGVSSRVRSRSLDFPIEFGLPDRESWRVADGPTWLVAEHVPSSSLLALRAWRADRLVRRAECEAQARLARRTIPIVREEAVVDRRVASAPQGFEVELVAGVEPSARGVSGYVIAIGSSVGRCYAAVFTTVVSGGNAEEEVATRLAGVVDRVLSGVRVRSVDERAVRRRLVSSPRKAPE
jgi:hypothetical protein